MTVIEIRPTRADRSVPLPEAPLLTPSALLHFAGGFLGGVAGGLVVAVVLVDLVRRGWL